MPTISFPTSPSISDEYEFSGRTWVFNGTGWVSEAISSVVDTFLMGAVVNDYREQVPGIAADAITVAYVPTAITYI